MTWTGDRMRRPHRGSVIPNLCYLNEGKNAHLFASNISGKNIESKWF